MAREARYRYTLYCMKNKPIRKLAAELAFVVGLSLMLLGIVLLVGTLAGVPKLAIVPASLGIVIGTVFAILAIKLNRRSQYIFLSAFCIQVAFLLLLLAVGAIPLPLARLWPLASVFAGMALIPAGWHSFDGPRVRFIVPAVAFIALGSVLSVFSFRMVPISFKRFMLDWWPLLLVLAGIFLALVSLSPSSKPEEHGP